MARTRAADIGKVARTEDPVKAPTAQALTLKSYHDLVELGRTMAETQKQICTLTDPPITCKRAEVTSMAVQLMLVERRINHAKSSLGALGRHLRQEEKR
jgi:hypothetical protein